METSVELTVLEMNRELWCEAMSAFLEGHPLDYSAIRATGSPIQPIASNNDGMHSNPNRCRPVAHSAPGIYDWAALVMDRTQVFAGRRRT